MIPVYKPYLTPEILRHAHDALDSGWVSSRGPYVELATEELKKVTGTKHALLVSSGTAACRLMAKAFIESGAHDYIHVPNNVYVASWNAFISDEIHMGVGQCELDTWNWKHSKSRFHSLQSLLVVHNLGNVVNVPRLLRDHPGLTVVEDCCEGLFGTYEGRPAGSAALCSAISFFGNKTVTSGEGGAFVTNDDTVFENAKRVANQGTVGNYTSDRLGYNYRMTNVAAALLYGQLLARDHILVMKRVVFDHYRAELPDGDRVSVQKIEEGTTPANWMMGVRVAGSDYATTEPFMRERGIEVRPMFPSIDKHAHLRLSVYGSGGDTLRSQEIFMLPSYPELTAREQDEVLAAVRELAAKR